MKSLKLILLLIIIILNNLLINSCSDSDDNLKNKTTENLSEIALKRDSDLLKLIDRVVSKPNNATTEIVCVDFVYPLNILIYNSNFEIIGQQLLVGDKPFSIFLGGLDPNQAISISYPIKTVLSDGTIFSVNNNSELKVALENCTNEDIINYYSGLFGGNGQATCSWKIPYDINSDNKYCSGVFEAKNDGTIKFSFDNNIYTGTWSFLFLNTEFQININLEGTSIVANDWNIGRKVIFDDGKMLIENSPKNIILKQTCEETTVYLLGQTGKCGGIVFYDKGFYSLGWRYLEVASTDVGFFEWGCNGSTIQNTSENIGQGFLNSAKITNYHDGLLTYYSVPSVCNSLNNGTVAAQKALLYNFQGFDDWYLPSKKELELIYTNLKLQNLGNFTNNKYWSSTEINANLVQTVDFNTGNNVSSDKIPFLNNIKCRAIRSF